METKYDVPSSSDLLGLPCWSRVAFAARCAARALPSYEAFKRATYAPEMARAVQALEETAGVASLSLEDASTLQSVIANASAEVQGTGNLDEILAVGPYSDPSWYAKPAIETLRWAFDTARVANDASRAADAASAAARQAIESARSVPSGDRRVLERSLGGIWSDYHNLVAASKRDGWTDVTPVAPDFFGLFSSFDISSSIGRNSSIIELGKLLDHRLMEYFIREPARLYELNPRQFEELVAELIHGQGFQPVLTQRTRDGGVDVIALDALDGSMKYLIECKRYSPEIRVGVGVVRQLGGVLLGMKDPTRPFGGWPRGIVATTSSFTRDARQELAKTAWVLEGRDFNGLVEWLRAAQVDQIRGNCDGASVPGASS